MIKYLLLPAFLLGLSVMGHSQESFRYQKDFKPILEQTKDANNALAYGKLLKRFQANDSTLTDFQVLALLIGFTGTPAYRPYKDLDIEREIFSLNGEGKYKEGLKLATTFLKTHPVSVKALFEKAYSFHKLGQEDSAKVYAKRGHQIFNAMYFSGNGLSEDSPAFALGPADGQDFIYKFVGAKVGNMGSGRDKDGNFLDMLEATFEDGRTIMLYFIIQHATEKMFSGASPEKEMKDGKRK